MILDDYHLLQDTKASIALVPGVADMNSADELAEGFTMLQDVIDIVSVVIIGVLLIVSLLIPMVVVFAAAGMFVGILGSWSSIRKFMDV